MTTIEVVFDFTCEFSTQTGHVTGSMRWLGVDVGDGVAVAETRNPQSACYSSAEAFGGLLGGILGFAAEGFSVPHILRVNLAITTYHLPSGDLRTRTSKAVAKLIALQPRTARVVRNGQEVGDRIEEAAGGDRVRPPRCDTGRWRTWGVRHHQQASTGPSTNCSPIAALLIRIAVTVPVCCST